MKKNSSNELLDSYYGANGWTLERRKKQSMLIHTWNPSSKSTGPRTDMGKVRSSLNALKHGGRAKLIQEAIAFFEKMIKTQVEIRIQANKKGNL